MFVLIPRRYLIAVLGFLSFSILNSQRINVSFALEVMTISPMRTVSGHNGTGCAAFSSPTNATVIDTRQGVYEWNSTIQGYILGSSFLGFVFTQIPGGVLAEKYGAKEILCLSLMCASFSNIISPSAADWGPESFIAAQIFKGLAQGLLQPAVSVLMARWYPKEEMSFLSSATYSGFPAGALIGGIVSGALCDSTILGGWPSVFYFFGFAGVFLAFVEVLLIYNSPEDCKERNSYDIGKTSDNVEKRPKPPLKAMLLSVPTWALLAGMIGQYWMTFYFITIHPAYVSDVLHLNITQNGLVSSLPYILQIFVTWIGSAVSDWLTRKNFASTDTVRKYCNTLSCLGFSISMLGVIYAGCNSNYSIACFFIAMASIGLGFPGSLTVPMDITKNFAGTLVGLSGTIASSSGFIIPVIFSHIVENEGDLIQWNTFIYISISVVMISGVIFLVFGSAELQNWDNPSIEELKAHPIDRDRNNKLKTVFSIT